MADPAASCEEGAGPSLCTVEELIQLLQETEPPTTKPKTSKSSRSVVLFINKDLNMVGSVNSYDEVYPGIIIGDQSLARNKDELRRLGVTHLVNAAMGERFNQVDTSEAYYADLDLKFLGIPGQDTGRFKLHFYFETTTKFIEEAVSSGGRVVVHCHQGLSRSAALVLAFLMQARDMSAADAIRTVRGKRAVFPNQGFLHQLCTLENKRRGLASQTHIHTKPTSQNSST